MRRIAIISLGVLVGACGLKKLDDQGGSACVPAPVQAVFDARCTLPGCHDGSAGGQGLSLLPGDSDAIIGQQAVQSPLPLVELGNPDGSYLALKMMAMPAMPITGLRMPQGANFDDPVVQADIALIVGWIGGAEFTGCGDSGGSDSSAGTTAPTTTVTTAATSDSGDTTGGTPGSYPCGLADLAPGVESPIVYGDGPDMIPTEIALIVNHNCGCHLTDEPFVRMIADSPDAAPPHMNTLADWRGMSSPSSMITTFEDVRNRIVEDAGPIIMPPPTIGEVIRCDVGDGEGMPPEERARLLQWIDAGGPDGASWPP